jgi:hypothetical protein
VLEPPIRAGPRAPTRLGLRRLAWFLALAALVQTIAILAVASRGDERFGLGLDLSTIGFLALVLLNPLVGALIVHQRPDNRVAWLMILSGLGWGAGLLTYGYGVTGLPPAAVRPAAVGFVVLSQVFFVPSFIAGAALLSLLFPTDRWLGPRWRLVGLTGLVGAVVYEAASLLHSGDLDHDKLPGLPNPLGAPAVIAGLVEPARIIGNGVVTAVVVLGAVSLVVRYRTASSLEAAQLRWVASAVALSAVAFAASPLLGVAGFTPEANFASDAGIALLGLLPIAVGIAITRYRLYDIDRLINRTLLYGSVTAILAGAFTAAIGLAQRVFVATTGEKSDAAIVLTTLVVATLYAPLRKRLEAVVDRHFKYDQRRFGQYRDELARLLTFVDSTRAAERLAGEAVRELGASGAGVLDLHDRPIATSGVWPVAEAARLPVRGQLAGPIRSVVVGPRADGGTHDPDAVAQLTELLELVATAARSA